MTTHLTKIWWDLNKHKLVEQAIPEAEIYHREWVGYTKEDRERIVPVLVQSLINHDEKTMAGLLNAILIDIEQQLKEKNT